ncbi:MAG: hypothetical protein K8U03_06495 [Planctomycetia bacterium]|nr:hypothetical protein [Planctomycetia bacterium]
MSDSSTPSPNDAPFASLPRYDARQSYEWNYEHAPEEFVAAPHSSAAQLGDTRDPFDVPSIPGSWEFCSLPVSSPLGIAAGPLLNGRWLRYYARLGFDVLTYKTVRSVERACFPLPNLVPVRCETMTGDEPHVAASPTMLGTWAVSFGMPSKPPSVWRADVEETRKRLPREKVLVVSVVASEQPGWTIEDLADDYARCARWAVESGADVVETNFSCPNVCTTDGQLYQTPGDAALCAERVREAIGKTPFVVKIGHIRDSAEAESLVAALGSTIDGLAMTNSVAAPVVDAEGRSLFDGKPRGICGAAVLEPSLRQTRMLRQVVTQRYLHQGIKPPFLIGVGGTFSAEDARRYLVAGAQAIHMATAVMVDPAVALGIRAGW